ncbi:lytic transglycosylase domain-containing protein [bacterium]|nr:lytic transglycosylase domain-containing protein [bacterium]
MRRFSQLNNYVDSFNSELKTQAANNNKVNGVNGYNSNPNAVSFDKVLKDSAKTKFGSLLLNPAMTKVNANIYANTAAGVNKQPITTKAQILNKVSEISRKYGVDEKLVNALIKQESGFNVNAKSKVGAQGLMQLMPATAKSMGVTDPMNPEQNIEGGVKYLRSMLDKYNGNIILALAAYNAGPGAVDKYTGVPPYKETQNYVRNILANYL